MVNNNEQSSIPLVSICCITYNHENFIREAIEGFLMQKTNFTFEILIHDDASTDGTADIIREYEKKYPELIKPIYQTENQYSKGIGISVTYQWPRAKGKYIALCEGDDYWTDPYKLQKQVDFLKANPEYGLVHTDCDQHYTLKNQTVKNYNKVAGFKHNKENAYEDILRSNYPVFTCTALFRRDFIQFQKQDKTFKMGDTILWLEIAHRAKIKYFPESTAVRNVLEESATQSRDWNKKLEFKKSGYELMKHFIDKYGCSAETEKIVHEMFNRVILNHAFMANRKEDADNAYTNLKKKDFAKFEDFIYDLGCKGSVERMIAKALFYARKVMKKFNLIS